MMDTRSIFIGLVVGLLAGAAAEEANRHKTKTSSDGNAREPQESEESPPN